MSTLKTIYDDVYTLIKDTVNGAESSASSDSSSSVSEIKVVKEFTLEQIQEKQVSVGINTLNNLQHSNVSDYEISVSVQGQTYFENDTNKEQILQLFGTVQTALQSLNVDYIEMYIDNIAGFLIEDSSFDSDQETNNFTINLKLYVTDLI